MEDFYVYTHKRKSDGSIFYVGKDRGNRAWDVEGRTNAWVRAAVDSGREVHIVADRLSECSALLLESMMISLYGELLVNVLPKGVSSEPKLRLGRARPFATHKGRNYYVWRHQGKKPIHASIEDMRKRLGGTYRQWHLVILGHRCNVKGWEIDRRYRDGN